MLQELKALTVMQPFASLLVLPKPWDITKGEKENETQMYPLKHKGQLLIHASYATEWLETYFNKDAFRKRYAAHGITDHKQLILGAIIGVVDIVSSKQIVLSIAKKQEHYYRRLAPPDHSNEYAFGNWQHSRFAWQFTNPRMFDRPYTISGEKGLWDITFDLEAALEKLAS